jgi:transposase
MAKPYSMDLRERVVASVERGGLSRNEAARRFGVGISTVIHWVRRFRETGSVAPSQIGGYKPKAIRGEHHVWLVSGSSAATSPCAGWWRSWPSAGSRWTIGRSGTSSMRRS